MFPLQVYTSALVFVPTSSIVGKTFKDAVPKWVEVQSNSRGQQLPEVQHTYAHGDLRLGVSDHWPSHFTLLKNGALMRPVLDYSYLGDGRRLISQSDEGVVEIQDVTTGAYLRRLHVPLKEGGYCYRGLTTLSLHGTRLACGVFPRDQILVLDVKNEKWQETAEAHDSLDWLVFSKTGDWLASISKAEAKP